MSQNHISPENMDKYVSGKIYGKDLNSLERHLEQCDVCRQEAEEYKLIVHAMRTAEIYEPGDDFVQQVTAELPDFYAPRQKPVLEIVSLTFIFVSFSIVAGLLFLNNLETVVFGDFFTRLSQMLQSIFSRFAFIKVLGDNLDIVGMAVVYFSLYKLFDRFVIQEKIKKQDS